MASAKIALAYSIGSVWVSATLSRTLRASASQRSDAVNVLSSSWVGAAGLTDYEA